MSVLVNSDDVKSQGCHSSNSEYKQRKKRQRSNVGWASTSTGTETRVGPEQNNSPIPDDDDELKTTAEDVMRFINAHQSYTPPGLTETITDQPKLDDVCRYGISEEQESQLWQLETERLMFAMKTSKSTFPFRFTASEYWQADKVSMEHLSTLADYVLLNIDVCSHDNQLVLYDNRPGHFEQTAYTNARQNLSKRRINGNLNKPPATIEGKSLMTKEQEQEFYCALIDYATAVAARSACYSIPNEFWQTRALAGLAKCAAKLKYLILDPDEFADKSLEDAQDILTKKEVVNYLEETNQPMLEAIVEDPNNVRNSRERSYYIKNMEKLLSSGDMHVDLYFTETSFASSWALDTLKIIFSGLKGSKLSGYSVDVFDICSIVYKTGWNDVPTLLSQDRNGKISGTTARNHLRALHEPYRILCQVARTIMEEQAAGKTRADPIPGDADGPFGAHLVLEMQKNDRNVGGEERIYNRPLPGASSEAKLRKLERTVRSWVMRRAFVVKTMALCGVLVVGGILSGTLVGERLEGVDPFNITTFAWVLAGFALLVAKSLFVSEWPWRDFLRGRVPCRSVSELHTVTGVDAQDVMEYLLAKESYTILVTKGPFNRPFTRRSDEGFSVDVKIELRTLVASGIIVLKVATQMGPALVCLDIRRGAFGRSIIGHLDGPEDLESLLGCFDFPEAFDEEEEAPLQTLSESMRWTRILGVYNRPYKKFR